MLTYISFQPAPMRHRFMTQQRKFPLLQPVLQTPWRCSAPGRSCEPKIRGEGGGRRRERRWRKEEEVKYPKCSHTDAKCACMVNHPLYFISWCGFFIFLFFIVAFYNSLTIFGFTGLLQPGTNEPHRLYQTFRNCFTSCGKDNVTHPVSCSYKDLIVRSFRIHFVQTSFGRALIFL